MLSIQPLESAKGAADYYTAAFNYYAGDAQALRWLGKGAERLGLNGVVDKETMLALLEGKLPDGQVLQNKKGEHRPGFDMTFSAPKSVSILAGLGFDKELELFHDEAVELAIEQLEKEFAETRIVKDGKVFFEKTNNFVIAAFRQPSSRANDPALHTHAVTFNMTFDKNDEARSLASDIHANRGVVEQLQRSVTYCGLLYRTHLANMLKEKGYVLIEAGDGLFEIAGMPDELLKAFSTRREDIEAYMKEKGWTGAKAASAATLLTRDIKEEHDINVLQENWIKRVDELGFDGHQFVKEALSIRHNQQKGLFERVKEFVFGQYFEQQDLEVIKAREAVTVAIETVSQKMSIFNRRLLKEYALRHTLTTQEIVSIESIDKAIEEKINDQSLYSNSNPKTQQTVLTTPWLLTLETESLARIEHNKGMVKSITSKKHVLDFQSNYELNAKYGLTGSQKQAMIQFLTNQDRYMAIQGYAGVGKTTMLKLTAEITTSKGFELRGLAVTSSAAQELTVKGGINADVFPVVHSELLRAEKGSLSKTIFIVDEASMLSSPQGHELIKLVEKAGARLYLIGDDAQLPSVKNGRIFGLSQEYGIQTANMVDNVRQKNQPLKEAVLHAIKEEVYDAVQKINEVREYKTHEARIEAMAGNYLHLSHHVRNNTLLFAPTHANRHEITALIREGLKKEGTLSADETEFKVLKPKALEEVQLYYAQYYAKGDVIRFNIESKRFGISKGDYLTVEKYSFDKKQNHILHLIHQNGKTIHFKLNELPNYQSTRAGFKRHIEVYRQETLALAEGDRILWTRNCKQEGIVNSERALVSSITDEHLTLILDSGEVKKISRDHNALKHLDHGYVFTNIKVQGKDKMYGIGLIESYNQFSATLRNFYVQISRSIYSMTLVTDDKNYLIRALENNNDKKTSAIDFLPSEKLIEHQKRYASHNNSLNINAVIAKKEIKEAVFQQYMQTIEEYRFAKESKNQELASELAFDIIADKTLYSLAKATLGYLPKNYRDDAHPIETLKLSKTLSAEDQVRLHTVGEYVNQSINSRLNWEKAREVNASSDDKRVAFNQSMVRNALAFKIANDIESYKPWLKHYSIGALNRLGLPQHRYQKEEENALLRLDRLSKQAAHHEIHHQVIEFFLNKDSSRHQMAFDIKAHSKVAHPLIIKLADEKGIAPEQLWKDIHFAAKEHADSLFKTTLSLPEQKIFDQIKTYRTLSFELGKRWKDNLNLMKNHQPLSKETEENIQSVAALRNQIAYLVIQNPSSARVLEYFKLDRDKFNAQASKHQQRENILDFLSSNSHFKNKVKAAERISLDIKGHYPFIKECQVNTKQLNQYIRCLSRKDTYADLSEAEIADHKTLLHYKYESKKASNSWKKVFSLKEQSIKPAPHLLNQALESTGKRDLLASKMISSPNFTSTLSKERVAVEKLTQHAKNHQDRINEINLINEERLKLLSSLEQNENTLSKQMSQQWHKSWDKLNQQTKKILGSKPLYQQALRKNPLHSDNAVIQQKNIVKKYDLTLNTSKNTIKTLKTASPVVDLAITNEVLMANPEQCYTAIFGTPKTKNSKELRYPGGLVVSLKGNKAGLWFDFGSGKGGSPIQAIIHENNVSFKEALAIAAKLAGTEEITSEKPIRRTLKEQIHEEKQTIKNKIISARSIMKGSKPIEDTLAERYLKEHRGLQNPTKLNMRFWPKNEKWLSLDDKGNLIEKINKIPALVIAAKNEKGDITGVQRVYLDEKTANKNTFMDKAKISKGHIKSSAGIIQEGMKFGTVYIAEGPETAATIAQANPKSTVLTAFGLSNIQNLGKVIKNYFPKEVIIAGDNDKNLKSKTYELTEKACLSLKSDGFNVRTIFPNSINTLEKTDWNDVLKQQGIQEVKKQLGIEQVQRNSLPIYAKDLEMINSKTLENLTIKAFDSNQSLKESYSFIKREEGRLTLDIEKSMQTKITDHSKSNARMIEHRQIEKTLIDRKNIELEI